MLLDTGLRRYDAKGSNNLFNELLRHYINRAACCMQFGNFSWKEWTEQSRRGQGRRENRICHFDRREKSFPSSLLRLRTVTSRTNEIKLLLGR